MKLLIVDPNVSLKTIKKEFGHLPGFFIGVVRKGKYSALDMLEETEYDFNIAIINLVQPRGDGISLTREIRWNEKLIWNKTTPMVIFWVTDAEINESCTFDPIIQSKDECQVDAIFTRRHGYSDLIWLAKEIIETRKASKA